MLNSAVVCMYFLFVLCILALVAMYRTPWWTSHRLKGHFLSKLKFISICLIAGVHNSHLSVIQKNFYKFDHPGGREAARHFSLQFFSLHKYYISVLSLGRIV